MTNFGGLLSKTFCPIPWNFQAVRNNGDLRICCQANVSAGRGILRRDGGDAFNAKDGELDLSRNSQLAKDIRKEMLNEKWHQACSRCYEEEKAGLESRRLYELASWELRASDIKDCTQADGTLDLNQSPVRYYDLRFGNHCNLSCRMCGPGDSDAWYDDYVQLTGHQSFKDTHGEILLSETERGWKDKSDSYNWYQSEKFWQELEANMENVCHIYMAGGEPLLIKKHYDFLEGCIAKGFSKNIILEYNTNLTILNSRVIDLWKQFKQVGVGASIDGFGEVFEFQRYPAQWSRVYENLKKLDSIGSPVMSWLACTVTVYNALHIPEFIEWKLTQSGFTRINSSSRKPVITHHMAHKPEHLNIRSLTPEQKAHVQAKYNEYRDHFRKTLKEDLSKKAIKILDSIETYMMAKQSKPEHTEEMWAFSKKLDQIRGQESARFLPKTMGYK